MSALDPNHFLTLAAPAEHEIDKIKGSRFLASARPVPDEAAALAFVDRVRAAHPRANHHCFAFRLGAPGDRSRHSDDGEPSGSAGRPILAQLEGHEVTDAVLVVTRYFGGTKLGVGGLMRAYGASAAALLDNTPLRRVVVTRRIDLEFPYACAGVVDGILHARGLVPESSRYGEHVGYVLQVPVTACAELLGELAERTGGRVRPV